MIPEQLKQYEPKVPVIMEKYKVLKMRLSELSTKSPYLTSHHRKGTHCIFHKEYYYQ